MKLIELQIDRLVGPTHHFGGLGVGNIASQENAGTESNPAAAALQGLDKMRIVSNITDAQLVLPPQPRPHYEWLRSLGFHGNNADVLQRAHDQNPILLSAATSCSAMWTANAATSTPLVDSCPPAASGKVKAAHLTIANLVASVHRAMEPPQTAKDLGGVLPSDCLIHPPLPGAAAFRDEGAANHMRLGTSRNEPGIHIFVFGDVPPLPENHWPRQTRAAGEAISRLHQLPPENCFFLKQHPRAIDEGAFHNDVVAMSHPQLLIHHEHAFLADESSWIQLEQRYRELTGTDLIRIIVDDHSLSLKDAVATYLFNSQIISPPTEGDKPIILCTRQVERHRVACALVHQWCDQGIFGSVRFVDLDQSMSGGGGPACLRLRVPLQMDKKKDVPRHGFWSESLDAELRDAIDRHYVTQLSLGDLTRIDFHEHADQAHKRVCQILRPQG